MATFCLRLVPSAAKTQAADSNLSRCQSKLWQPNTKGKLITKITLCVVFNFAQSFFIHKINTFAPKMKFTQTAARHGIRVKAEVNKFYLDTNPIEQCGASASEDRGFRRYGKVLPMIVRSG